MPSQRAERKTKQFSHHRVCDDGVIWQIVQLFKLGSNGIGRH
jgi:hypothetical protein